MGTELGKRGPIYRLIMLMIRVIQGDKGYVYMRYEYMTDPNLVYDAYTIQKFSSIDLGQGHWKRHISELEFTGPTTFGSSADDSGEDDWSFQEMENGKNDYHRSASRHLEAFLTNLSRRHKYEMMFPRASVHFHSRLFPHERFISKYLIRERSITTVLDDEGIPKTPTGNQNAPDNQDADE